MATDTLIRPTYAADYHLWALDQARRLRAMAALRPNAPIDWELLAEEVEELARSDRRACESYVELIVAHLLKLQFSALSAARGHWRGEIANFRALLEKTLTPSIERALRDDLARRLRTGRKLAVERLAEDEPGFAARLPAEPAYTLEQITGDWLPGREATATPES
jgi:hypothetical protein